MFSFSSDKNTGKYYWEMERKEIFFIGHNIFSAAINLKTLADHVIKCQ